MSKSQGSIKNPFSNLSVRRDVEDIVAEEKTVQQEETPMSLEGTTEYKKRKIRPEEKSRISKEQLGNIELKMSPAELDQGGFKEIRKVKKPDRLPEDQGLNPSEVPRKENFKAIHKTHIYRPKGRNRIFDRHSGTGRGREISKGGAGGKTTWGDIDQFAKENVIEYMAQEQAYNPKEDYCK